MSLRARISMISASGGNRAPFARLARRIALIVTLPIALAVAMIAAPSRESAAAGGNVASIAQGKVLVERLQCSRCHAASGMPIAAAPRATSCAGCHAWISGTKYDSVQFEREHARFPYWERYVENVESFLAVPDFGAASRLDVNWIARYVRDPYEVRPGQYERMLRAPVTEDEARSIAAFLRASRPVLAGVAGEAAAIPVSTNPTHIAEGAALATKLQCGRCHAFGALDRDATRGAPDLAHTRDRMAPADVAAFIANPDAFGQAGGGRLAMPTFDLTAVEAARLRDYVLAFPIEPELAAAVPADLPLLARPVAWEEVRSQVFGRICVHCHMTAANNAGEGGPGNTGGLGFAGKGLDLESWDAIAKSTVLAPRAPGEEAPLIARLRIRAGEHAREIAGPYRDEPAPAKDAVRGMPIALPALSPEEMQLIRTWVAQGAPGPDGRLAITAKKSAADRVAKAK